jgi:hypothetical protein
MKTSEIKINAIDNIRIENDLIFLKLRNKFLNETKLKCRFILGININARIKSNIITSGNSSPGSKATLSKPCDFNLKYDNSVKTITTKRYENNKIENKYAQLFRQTIPINIITDGIPEMIAYKTYSPDIGSLSVGLKPCFINKNVKIIEINPTINMEK